MSENITTQTTRDFWTEARKMSISLQQLPAATSTLRVTWTLPPTPWKAYGGGVVVLSESPLPVDVTPEDGKKYVASSNWAAPADLIGEAKVVASFYSYFGDNLTTSISVDVTNTDPTKLYYATIYPCTQVLQYYASGIPSYPIDGSEFTKSSDAYAGSIPSSSEPPANPTNGQVYYDPHSNKVLVWNANALAWIESNSDIQTGDSFPIQTKQVYGVVGGDKLRIFIAGMGWLDCNASNTRVKTGGTWAPLGTVYSTTPTTPVAGDINIIGESAPLGISAGDFVMQVFTMGQWLNFSNNLVQFETAPGVWEDVVLSQPVAAGVDPTVPQVGAFFYHTIQRSLFVWSGSDWSKADTEQVGTPTYDKIGNGQDGSRDEYSDLIRILKTQMGWPSICIELTEEAFNVAIEDAVQTFRQRADNAYIHRFVLFTLNKGQQLYYLNDPRNKSDRVVNVLKIHRINMLGAAQWNDPVYGQLFIPGAMGGGGNVGQFDLTALHLLYQQSETFERIFAGNLMYTWDEASRQLMIHRNITQPQERVVLEVVMERTKQELFTDRWCQQWIQGFALAQLKQTLGYIRTKYGSVAGPNGGLTLNGDALLAEAQSDFQELNRQINDYEVGNGGVNFGNTAFFIG